MGRKQQSDFDHLKIFFARAAFWANPVGGHIGPFGTSGYAVVGVALGFVINPAADGANIGFEIVVAHGGLLRVRGLVIVRKYSPVRALQSKPCAGCLMCISVFLACN